MLEHFTVLDDDTEPKTDLPENLSGKKVLLKCTGGLGDVLITIGAGARHARGADVTACVRGHHRALTSFIEGVDKVYPSQMTNNLEFLKYFDYYIDFAGIFNNRLNLIKGNYYDALESKIGSKGVPGKFTFSSEKNPRWVAIHPSASNPNRVWDEARWGKVALSLRDNGYRVFWLGCKDEFGFNSENIFKLSAYSEDLVYQSMHLSRCGTFLGNDSGFCHVAGLCGVPGYVVFSSTHERDVVSQYSHLHSIDKFTSYDDPTRSLCVSDSKSLEFLDSITVQDVLGRFGIQEVSSASVPTLPKAGQVGVVVAEPLSDDLKRLMPFVDEKYDIVKLDKEENKDFPVISQSGGITYIIRGGEKYRVSVANEFGFMRALREVGR